MPKKYWKLVAKGSQNDAKMENKINENSYFSEKGWNARNYLFYNRKRGFRYLKIILKKSDKNQYKINTRKRHAKSMENNTKMHTKWESKSIQNLENTLKNDIRKLMPKFDAKKIKTVRQPHFFIDFGSISWPCRGVRGAEDTWKYWIDSNNLTRSSPWWGAADPK